MNKLFIFVAVVAVVLGVFLFLLSGGLDQGEDASTRSPDQSISQEKVIGGDRESEKKTGQTKNPNSLFEAVKIGPTDALPNPVILPAMPENAPVMPIVPPGMPQEAPEMPSLVVPEGGGMPYVPEARK